MRVVAATNRNLQEGVKQSNSGRTCLILGSSAFVDAYNTEFKKQSRWKPWRGCQRHLRPRNVRELANTIERARLLSENTMLGVRTRPRRRECGRSTGRTSRAARG